MKSPAPITAAVALRCCIRLLWLRHYYNASHCSSHDIVTASPGVARRQTIGCGAAGGSLMRLPGRIRWWLACAALVLAAAPARAALLDDWMAVTGDGVGWEVACYDIDLDASCMFNLRLYGRILPGTVAKVQKALTHRLPQQRVVVTLSSPGGDIDAAMKLGRIFRDARAHTEVRQGQTCISACALAYAGGIVRHAFDDDTGGQKSAKIGIHRPALAAVPKQTDMNALKRPRDEPGPRKAPS